jgi:hypothetical protein
MVHKQQVLPWKHIYLRGSSDFDMGLEEWLQL